MASTYTVSGQFFDQFNTTITNARVQTFDKDLQSQL